jgi:diguanylate cyclase (GGDEF)-like protein
MTDELQRLQRLERRLDRERRARREAEEIAERSSRELYARQRELTLLASVGAAANRATALEQALGFTLEQLCRHLGWAAGQVWLRDEETGVLELAPVRYIADESRSAPLLSGSAGRRLAAGEDLPGRILDGGEPLWITDPASDPGFTRAAAVREAGLSTVLGFPVVVDERVVAVFECFAEAELPEAPEVLSVIAQIGDLLAQVFERDRSERRLRHEARHDELTGLPNRGFFQERLAHLLSLADRSELGIAVAILDVDHFKEVNDTLGHQQGDRLLIEVGRRLSAVLGESDTIARLGGDEFALILSRVRDEHDAAAVAGRVAAALREPVRLADVPIAVDASIGLALYPHHGDDLSELMRHADVAMYEAKRAHAVHRLYSPPADPHSPHRLGLVGELREALERERLLLHYQPQISTATGAPAGVEALLRWPRADGGFVPPSEFIPLAERTGLIAPITGYVLGLALAQAREWHAEGLQAPVAVNISPLTLLDESFPAQVEELLVRHRVPARLLELEITESSMLEDPERTRRVLCELDEIGVGIAIDDFGTGYSSLAQLKVLPVGRLKIDGSFVSTMIRDERDGFIVRAAIRLGHDLGMSIVAEGVEDADTLAALAELGCDSAQGYFIHRPAAPEILGAWLGGRAAPSPARSLA